jgi:thioredoxin 1
MGANTLHITDDTFESQVLKSDVPVLVDFWAEWCAPCRALGPTIDELAKDYAGKARVAKVDVDKAQNTAVRYGIQSIPTIIIFKNGEVVDMRVGGTNKADLSARLDKAMR